jgi:hypothetical protein
MCCTTYEKRKLANESSSERKKLLDYDPLEDADHFCVLQHYFDGFSRMFVGCSSERCDKA